MSTEEEIANILKDNVHFVPQVDGYMVHGAVAKLIEMQNKYAREMSCEFARWLSGEGWQQYDEADRWICPTNNYNVITTDQLYDKYLDHLSSLNRKK
jgi:hypothetical protein